jgi:hypothetical protein
MDRTTMFKRRGALGALLAAVLLLVASLAIAAPAGATSARSQAGAGSPDCISSATGNGRYVAVIYRLVLDRCPDTQGAAFWAGQLDAKKISRTAFAQNIVLSIESLGSEVRSFYQEFLDRAPSATEQSYWATRMHDSGLLFPTAAQIAGSSEAYDNLLAEDSDDPQQADRDFIELIYDSYLDRDVDEVAGDFWLSYLGTDDTHSSTVQTRTAMVLSVLRSDEFSQFAILGLYEGYLDRAPDSGGAQFWLAYLHAGNSYVSFISTILGSDEFYNDTQTTVSGARRAMEGKGGGLTPLAGPQGVAARAKAASPTS